MSISSSEAQLKRIEEKLNSILMMISQPQKPQQGT